MKLLFFWSVRVFIIKMWMNAAHMRDQLGEPKRSPNMTKRCSKTGGNTKKVKAVFPEFTQQEQQISHLGYLING